MELKMEKIFISFKDFELKNFSLMAENGKVTAIVGPSGSGKTTVLRTIAGLESPISGKIFFGEKQVTHVPAEQRNIGMVFQGDSLFSHLDVFENVAFGLRMKKEKKVREKVLNALRLVRLKGFEKRNTNTLSGGEKKRVAIARAIAFEPEVLLLDEPLNGLDAGLKEKTKQLLKEIQEKTGKTMVFVTHDVDEAFFLSDKIVVINKGKTEQEGLPQEIFLKPKNVFVKEFVSEYMLVKGKNVKKNGKTFVEGKFSFEAKKRKGKPTITIKKSNYKFL